MTLRFVHLSDIHFGQETDGTVAYHMDVRDELVNDCVRFRDSCGYADGILITGDISYSGKHQEFDDIGNWLDTLATAVGCDRTAVWMVPGNHDVDRRQVVGTTKLVHKSIRTASLDRAHDDLAEVCTSAAEAANPLLPKLAAYRMFAARYQSDFETAATPFWSKTYDLGGGRNLVLAGLTSVLVSDQDDDQGRMILGKKQYILKRCENTEYVVLAHHPLDWCMDRDEAEKYLHSRARVLMYGHRHNATFTKSVDGMQAERLQIDAGATNPAGSPYLHSYNWLEFSLSEEEESVFLDVRVFPRIWASDPTEFVAHSSRLGGQEHATFRVCCPQFKTNTQQQVVSVAASEPVPTIAEKPHMTKNAVSELSFIFWKLPWRERLRVLVEADLLPKTADQPVPQTMEHMALKTAVQTGKAKDLWIAVKRARNEDISDNPFT